jgi:hypothetical protein
VFDELNTRVRTAPRHAVRRIGDCDLEVSLPARLALASSRICFAALKSFAPRLRCSGRSRSLPPARRNALPFGLGGERPDCCPHAPSPEREERHLELIHRMAAENGTWGTERIRGEFLKLGICMARQTIQRHIRAVQPPEDEQRWTEQHFATSRRLASALKSSFAITTGSSAANSIALPATLKFLSGRPPSEDR